jgi:ribosome-binding protein aMBF1 (putative translation factor)
MKTWEQLRDEILDRDPETRREYERLGPLYQIVSDVIRYRHTLGLSQEELAARMGKQQPAIARFEAARVTPSLAFLQELAEALDLRLTVRLEPKEAETSSQGGTVSAPRRRKSPKAAASA